MNNSVVASLERTGKGTHDLVIARVVFFWGGVVFWKNTVENDRGMNLYFNFWNNIFLIISLDRLMMSRVLNKIE